MIDYKKLRCSHKPGAIKLLILAISPPEPWDGHEPFFYNEADMPAYGLFQATMKALYPDRWLGTKKELLDRFQNGSRFYLIDASDAPLKKRRKTELEEIAETGAVIDTIRSLAEEGSFADSKIRLAIVGTTMFRVFHDYLLRHSPVQTSKGQFDIVIVHDKPLPFPHTKRSTEEFVQKLAKIAHDMG